MTLMLVVPAADAQDVRTALGKLYAASVGQPWPIPGRDAPTGMGVTLYYCDPRPSADGTQAAFDADDFVVHQLGASIDGVTIPSALTNVDESTFFPPLPDGPL